MMFTKLEKVIATACITSFLLLVGGALGMFVFAEGLLFIVFAVVWMLGVAGLWCLIIGIMWAVLKCIWREK